MNTMEKIVEEVQTLPETDAREVLDFVGYLKAKRAQAKTANADMSEFDQFGAVYERGEATEPEHEINLALFCVNQHPNLTTPQRPILTRVKASF